MQYLLTETVYPDFTFFEAIEPNSRQLKENYCVMSLLHHTSWKSRSPHVVTQAFMICLLLERGREHALYRQGYQLVLFGTARSISLYDIILFVQRKFRDITTQIVISILMSVSIYVSMCFAEGSYNYQQMQQHNQSVQTVVTRNDSTLIYSICNINLYIINDRI